MDDFRKIQKGFFPDAAPNSRGVRKYGCPCCCVYNCSLNKAKKYARKEAKSKFRRETKELISKELESQ